MHNTVLQYIATRPILELCDRYDQRPVVRVSQWLWEQAGIDLEGAKKRAVGSATDSDSDSDLGIEESSGASG